MKAPLARVLAVEDHPEIGNLMRAALTRACITATVITTGEEALAVARQQPFDLILLDITLPGMSGLDVCRRLRSDKAAWTQSRLAVSAQASRPHFA